MARSLPQSVEMNAEIVKTVRMVLTSHPLFTVASLIFQIIINPLDYLSIKGASNLRDRIVKMMRYLRESLNGYWQKSTILMALHDTIAEKMKTPSEALKKQLAKDAAKDYPKARLIGKFALSAAVFLLKDTEFFLTYDEDGTKMCGLWFFLLFLLLMPSKAISNRFRVLCMRTGWKVNATSNFTCFFLAFVFEKFSDKSWRSLSAGFCVVVYFLSVMVIARRLTDFGFFGLIIGAIGSVAYNCYGFKVLMWVIACICFMLFSFKSWLDKYWLKLEDDTLLPSTTDNIGAAAMIISAPTFFFWVMPSLPVSRFLDNLSDGVDSFIDRLDNLSDYLGELGHEDLFRERGLDFLRSVVTYVGIFFAVAYSAYVCLCYLFLKIHMIIAVRVIAKNHLPFSHKIKLSTREAIRWTTFSVLLDILFLLLEITSRMKLAGGLLLIGNLSVIVFFRFHSLKFPIGLFEGSLDERLCLL